MAVVLWIFMDCFVSHTKPTPTVSAGSARHPITTIDLLTGYSAFWARFWLWFKIDCCSFISLCLIICHFKPVLKKHAIDWEVRFASTSKAISKPTFTFNLYSVSSWILHSTSTIWFWAPFSCCRYINIKLSSCFLELLKLLGIQNFLKNFWWYVQSAWNAESIYDFWA